MSFSFSNTTRTTLPTLPYARIAHDIMGPHYEVSFVTVGNVRSRTLNLRYRNKSYTPNVLSFPLTENAGEVYLNPHEAKRQASRFDLTYRGMCGYLFIHALLHLKGYAHGDTMERVESRYMKKYGLS